MKIRIFKNSVRIRISKSELLEFSNTGQLEETTHFGPNSFTYRLQADNTISNLDANFANGVVTMMVPQAAATTWATTEQVGMSHSKEVGAATPLFLLLEKDFKCIDNTGNEDQSDNFDNPSHVC